MFYTSDTAFCENVVAYARGAKLLITEATFVLGMEEMAKSRRHMSSSHTVALIEEA